MKTYPIAPVSEKRKNVDMFLRATNRRKDGKDHRYFSIEENRRVSGGRTVQKTLLYLGEINDNQKAAWSQTIEVIEGKNRHQVALFPQDRPIPCETENGIQLRMEALELRRPRQWGACWLASHLWKMLGMREFWEVRLDPSRKGTQRVNVLETLVNFRFIDPGSEWKLHRYWFDQSAMGDLLAEDFRIAAKNTLYRCHDKLLQHKTALFQHLRQKWEDLFGAKFEVLLYDLTSTYFESSPPFADKRKFGYCHRQNESRLIWPV